MPQSVIQRAFNMGELSPSYGARADLATFTRGLRTCRNFLPLESGGVSNRSGSRYLATVKNPTGTTYLMPVVFANELAYVVEVGNLYFRFYRNGAQVMNGPTPYEVTTPYLAADLASLQFEQTGDMVTITHRSYAPRELTTAGDTSWTLSNGITTSPSISAPSGLAGTGGPAGGLDINYVVTAVKEETLEESLPSSVETLSGVDEPTPTDPIDLTWTPVTGALEYNVYKDPYNNGALGFVGRAKTAAFRDVGLLPDFSQTPPLNRVLFGSSSNYPAAVGYYQQRRVFASSANDPETIWASRIGFHKNFSIRSPLQDDDAVTFRLASRAAQDVRYLIDLKRLLVMTSSGEWKINGDGEGGALIPRAINPDRQGHQGCKLVRPQVLGEEVFFVQARGQRVRKLSLEAQVEGLGSDDTTVYSRHLFKGKTITRLALQKAPQPVLWAVRSDGVLLSFTYVPELETAAWARHDTGDGDLIEDVVCVPEGDEDGVYILVNRNVDGGRRYVERLASRQINSTADDAWFVDSGLAYSGSSTTNFSGLDHLAGRTVKAMVDGVALSGSFTVGSGGSVQLSQAGSKVKIGLPITAQIETLSLDANGTDVRDKRKRVNAVTVLVEESPRGFKAGPSSDKLTTTRRESWDTSNLITGAVEARIPTTWSGEGRVLIQNDDPQALTILGIIPSIEIGG